MAKTNFLLALLILLSFTSSLDAQISHEASSLNKFTVDFSREIEKDETGDYVFSGVSLQQALLMAYYGSKEETKKEFEFLLNIRDDHRPAKYVKLAQDLEKNNGADYYFKVANKLWVHEHESVNPVYQEKLKADFKSEAEAIDFSNPDEAAKQINTWVDHKTEKLISELVKPEHVAGSTVALTNAVVFNAKWLKAFEYEHTSAQPFYNGGSEPTYLPTMKGAIDVGVVKEADYEGYVIPFNKMGPKGWDRSFFVMMPNEGKNLSDLKGYLKSDHTFYLAINEVDMYNMNLKPAIVEMPRFKVETPINASSVLQNMGLQTAFSPLANFSGISPGLRIKDVVHKAYIDVAEDGVKAGGATMVSFSRGGPNLHIKINRPFYYFILDNTTGAILFMGRFKGGE